ncbi:MAG: hypothetical protein Kow0090_07570 [Myxococcota bacterium]
MPKSPRILAVVPALIPSVWICIIKPLSKLHLAGKISFSITLEKFATRFELKKADLVLFCRNAEPRYIKPLETAMAMGKPIIYDIDDNFFDIPAEWELGKYYREPERVRAFERYLSAADLVRVYSNPMLGRAKRLNDSVEKIFAPIDLSLVAAKKKKSNGGKIKIVYATSRMNDACSAIFAPALKRFLQDFGDKVEFTLWGFEQKNFPTHPAIRRLDIIRDYDAFLRAFSAEGFDIGLAPLFDDIFHRSKTNNKFREYGACGVSGVYSNVDVYSDCVKEGETGLLVENTEEAWSGALVKLAKDGELREKIARNAKAFVENNYSQERYEEKWLEHIAKVLASERKNRRIEGVSSATPPESLAQAAKRKLEKARLIIKDKNHRSFAVTLTRIYFNDLKSVLKLRARLIVKKLKMLDKRPKPRF